MMCSPKILIMMGVSGSGKTEVGQQLAQELDWNFFDGDDFHSQENINKMSRGIPLTDIDRDAWLDALQTLIHQQIAANQPAIITCSALKQAYRERLQIDPSVQFVYLKGSYELISNRLKQRANHYMSAALLDSQFETLEEPKNTLAIDVSQPPNTIIKAIMRQFPHL